MFVENFFFNLFFFFTVLSALFVVLSTNAVHSVLFLILTFCNIIFLLLLIGAEFFAFLLLIVYVGAIAVLFLFVVMMLNIKTVKIPIDHTFFYFPLVLVNVLFLTDYFYNFIYIFDCLKNISIKAPELDWVNWIQEPMFFSNVEVIGSVLYSKYCLLFLLSGFILLVAMIGAIVLTVYQKPNNLTKKQKITSQLNRDLKKAIKFVTIRKK